MNAQEYIDLQTKQKRLQSQVDEAKGALDEMMKRLADEFGCDSLEEALETLRRLKTSASKAQRKFDKQMKRFENEFGKLLQKD